MPGVFRQERVVADDDADELGHLNNVVWLGYVIDLAAAHSTAVGLDLPAYQRIGAAFVVRRHEIEYAGSAFPGDRLGGETWISFLRGARSIRHARFRAADGRVLLRCRTEWAFVDLGSQRPRRIPPEVQERFELVAEHPESGSESD